MLAGTNDNPVAATSAKAMNMTGTAASGGPDWFRASVASSYV